MASSSSFFQVFLKANNDLQNNEHISKSAFKIDFSSPVENATAPLPSSSPSSSSSSSSSVILRTLRHNPHDSGANTLPPPTTSFAHETTINAWIPHQQFPSRSKETSESLKKKPKSDASSIQLMNSTIPSSSSSTSKEGGNKGGVVGHAGLGHYVYVCWAEERGCVLRPDLFWFTICAEFAREVRLRPELYRTLFTTAKEGDAKETILLITQDDTALPLEDLDLLLQEKIVCKELHDLIVNNQFGSTVPVPNQSEYSQAIKILFANACTPFYDIRSSRCGIPFVKIEGAQEDWRNLGTSIQALEGIITPLNKSFSDYLSRCARTIEEGVIPNAFYSRNEIEVGEGEKEAKDQAERFFSGLFWITKKCGSGHPYACRGWILDFYYRSTSAERHFGSSWYEKGDPCAWEVAVLSDLPTHSVFVPWRNEPTNRKFVRTAGLFYSLPSVEGFLHPYYGTNTYEITDEEVFSRLAVV